MSFPHGFGIPLVDFAFFVLFSVLSDHHVPPSPSYRWLWFILCVALALLFFLAWLMDLGVRL